MKKKLIKINKKLTEELDLRVKLFNNNKSLEIFNKFNEKENLIINLNSMDLLNELGSETSF